MSTTGLKGKRVALTGPRKAEELGRMVTKQGGIPLIRPAQGTVYLEEDELVQAGLSRLLEAETDWFIFTTGVGIETLLSTADKMGIREKLLERMRGARLAARGYKAVGALRKLGMHADARDDDGTTAGLVRELDRFNFEGKHAALQLHGDPAPRLVKFLKERGASFQEILPYRHIPPEEEQLAALVGEIVRGEADAVLFTSGAQVRFIFEHARLHRCLPELLAAFHSQVVAAAVGKFTAECLREEGVERIVVPEEERMGNLVLVLSAYFTCSNSNS